MSAEEFSRYDSMKLFLHQIYEFQKGVRSLVLCTMCRTCASLLSERLERLGIAYRIQSVTDSKVNLYFGNRMCLETVATFIHKPLNELSAEEDFMLGAMLGYDIAGQCERYCKRKSPGVSSEQAAVNYSFLICAVNESPAPTPSATSTCGVATYDMPSGVNTWLPTAPQVSITVRSPYFSSRSRHCACMPNIRLTTVNSSSFVFRILLRQSESWTTSGE